MLGQRPSRTKTLGHVRLRRRVQVLGVTPEEADEDLLRSALLAFEQ